MWVAQNMFVKANVSFFLRWKRCVQEDSQMVQVLIFKPDTDVSQLLGP